MALRWIMNPAIEPFREGLSSLLERARGRSLNANSEVATVSLDELSEVLGMHAPLEAIEQAIEFLESHEVRVDVESPVDLGALLRQVLSAARELRRDSMRFGLSELAQKTGLSLREVKVALLYAEVLKR